MQGARWDSPRSSVPALMVGAYACCFALCPTFEGKLLLVLPLVVVPVCWWTLATPAAWMICFAILALLSPPLPFALGDTGVHPSLALAALGLLAGGLRIDEWRLRMSSLGRRMLIFTALLFASAAMSIFYSGSQIALGSFLRVFLFCISVYVFFYAAYGPGESTYDSFRGVRLLFWIGVASAGFACLDFYFQFPPPAGYGPQFIWLSSGVYRRAQGVFYEAGTLGNFCAFFLVMIAVALFKNAGEKPLRKGFLLGGGAIFSIALLLSFSRSSLLNLGVSICALLYLNRGRIRLGRLFIAAAILTICIAIPAVSIFPASARLYWTRIANSFLYFAESPNAILSGRLESWSYLLRFLADHPVYALFGVGYKTLPYSKFLGRTVIADNSYLSFLVETGVAGLAAVLSLCFGILRVSRLAAASMDTRTSFFGTWIFCFWCGEMAQMMSGDILTYWRVLPVYFWVLAMTVRRP